MCACRITYLTLARISVGEHSHRYWSSSGSAQLSAIILISRLENFVARTESRQNIVESSKNLVRKWSLDLILRYNFPNINLSNLLRNNIVNVNVKLLTNSLEKLRT